MKSTSRKRAAVEQGRPPAGHALSADRIKQLLKDGVLVVTPLLDIEQQLGQASLDVRLGDEFITLRRASISDLDVGRSLRLRSMMEQYQTRGRVRPYGGRPIVLHPGQLIIGATLEYVSLPLNVMAYLVGRSSWGRLGLIVATATFIDPGFKGVIVLELCNDGEVPISLYPGVRIAQLSFHELTGSAEGYRGKYEVQTRPEFSRIYEDPELPIFVPPQGRG